MNKDDILENKVKYLFYGQVSYFEALYLIIKLALYDAFILTDNKGKAIAGAIFGATVSIGIVVAMSYDKAGLLYIIFFSVGCLIMAMLLNVFFKKGGFFSYMFFSGSLPILIAASPFIACICSVRKGRYVSFRYDLPYNYSGRLTGVKGTRHTGK